MMYQKIEVEIREQVGIVRLNDPTALNAAGPVMLEELSSAIRTLGSSARVVLITGKGRGFCAGATLDSDSTGPTSVRSERDFGAILETHVNPLMSALRSLPVPWITAVRGAAAGVGASLALAADLIVASENAYFLQAFCRIGLVPDGGSAHILVKTIGRVRAMELMLLADRLPAAKALEWGLVNRVVSDATLEHEAFALASRLAQGPAIALRLTRQLAWSAVDADWDASLQRERESQRMAGRTMDADEGIHAFLEKRTAVFTGT
jgi:2-(1,2-epoxy-1,2-dihydrophenyl)acetyl-CoA isomerase